MAKIYEYRGVEGLVYAPIVSDTAEAITYGTVKSLAGVAEISRTTDSSNEAHYYDNIPAVVVSSTGSDEVTISASAIPLEVLAEITGQAYDGTTGMFIEEERTPGYFAIGYQTKTTDGTNMFVWRLKGTFNIPDTTSATEDDGTDANGQEITFTGINTIHKFTKTGKSAKAITVDTSVNDVDETTFFGTVQTPDTVTHPSIALGSHTLALDVNGGEYIIINSKTPSSATVTWSSSDEEVATVSNGYVVGVSAGTATITASIPGASDTCSVTVIASEAESENDG